MRPATDQVDPTPVLIAGAGPAGLVTAIELARQGVRPLVIERHPSTSIFPRATGVSTRSMEIFRRFGIEDEVRRGGWGVIARQATVERLDDPSPREEPLGFPDEAESAAVSPSTAAVSPQDHLEPILVDELGRLGGEVRFSTELVSFTLRDDGVDVTLRDRATGATSPLRVDYLVGADGHASTVRTGLGIAMDGPADLGRYVSILFRADLSEVLGERRYGLYMIEAAAGPPSVVVPSGADGRFVLGVPVPPELDDAAIAAAFSPAASLARVRAVAGRPDLPVEILATGSFAFAAQVAGRVRDGRAFLVGDAAHRMTPRGGRGMNTAIADGLDLGWKLAWVIRGLAGPALLDTYEAERGPVGRRNVALSLSPAGGGSADGLVEDLGVVVASAAIVPEMAPAPGARAGSSAGDRFVPDARPGARAPHAWLEIDGERRSTLDLAGPGFVLLTAGERPAWQAAASSVAASMRADAPAVRVVSVGDGATDLDGTFLRAYGLADGGAILMRPDGLVAWRARIAPDDRAVALAAALAIATGRPPARIVATRGRMAAARVVAAEALGYLALAGGLPPAPRPMAAPAGEPGRRGMPPPVAVPAPRPAGPAGPAVQPAGNATTKRLLA